MKKWGKRIGYGIGDLGCNLVFSTMASYLMVFYTDVFGITAAAAGTMMLVTKFIDALTDTGMGFVGDAWQSHTAMHIALEPEPFRYPVLHLA